MQTFFTSDFFRGNRQRLRAEVGTDAPIVFAANGLLQRGADSNYSFCQDANFWYLTGIAEPDLYLVIDGAEEYLIVPPRDDSRTAFDGIVDFSDLTKKSGISQVVNTGTGWRKLRDRIKETNKVATVAAPPAYIERYGLYANPARQTLHLKLAEISPKLEIKDIGRDIVYLRMIKQPKELAAIQAAIDITLKTIKDVTKKPKLAKYSQEYQIEADIFAGFRSQGASGHAFEPIVAGGKQACTLHYVANNAALSEGELIVIDVGAEVEHYAADITRTVAKGEVSPRAQQVHAAVIDVQKYAYSLLMPGVLLRDYEKKIENYMGKKLIELGLIKDIEQDNVRDFYPHSTSHFLGLNVHDVGDYDRPLEPGMVLTVEPGIYVPAEAIGVRIEDDVLITETGIKILSKKSQPELL